MSAPTSPTTSTVAPSRPPGGSSGTAPSGSRGSVADRTFPRFAQAVAEVLAGYRSPRQLARRMNVLTYRKMLGGIGLYRARTLPWLSSSRVCRPTDRVVEMSAVIVCGTRRRALALRLERVGAEWVCTQIETA